MPTLAELDRYIVWDKGRKVLFPAPLDPAVWRQDDFGQLIRWSDYGDRNSAYGWEIDHRVPTGLGGSDLLSNKRPLHCSVNAGLGGLLGAALGSGPTDNSLGGRRR